MGWAVFFIYMIVLLVLLGPMHLEFINDWREERRNERQQKLEQSKRQLAIEYKRAETLAREFDLPMPKERELG